MFLSGPNSLLFMSTSVPNTDLVKMDLTYDIHLTFGNSHKTIIIN